MKSNFFLTLSMYETNINIPNCIASDAEKISLQDWPLWRQMGHDHRYRKRKCKNLMELVINTQN